MLNLFQTSIYRNSRHPEQLLTPGKTATIVFQPVLPTDGRAKTVVTLCAAPARPKTGCRPIVLFPRGVSFSFRTTRLGKRKEHVVPDTCIFRWALSPVPVIWRPEFSTSLPSVPAVLSKTDFYYFLLRGSRTSSLLFFRLFSSA